MKSNGLYVHIPFCGAICHYCDFVKFIYHKDWIDPYIERLNADLAFFNVPRDLKTIYVGGGTPTSLSYDELLKLLTLLAPYAKHVREYTFEANIESITKEKLILMQQYGVNRLSVGVQTTDDERLIFLNRKHTYTDIKAKIKLIKEVGFTNFSVDLIYGLPTQTKEELAKDIKNILKLDAPHISTYALSIERNTVAFIRGWPEVSSDESRLMYDDILNALRKTGYERYEVSNFARPGFESVHNKLYWQNKHYYAIGLGASGYINKTRYTISGGLTRYLQGKPRIVEETIDATMFIEEYFMLNLRLKSGFSIAEFNTLTGKDFKNDYNEALKSLVKDKLLIVQDDEVYCTDDGLMVLDSIILRLIT